MQTHDESTDSAARTTAEEWLVALDASSPDRATAAAFLSWLRSDPGHEADLERCEALLAMAGRLADDGEIGTGTAQSFARTARLDALAGGRACLRWITQPGLRTVLVVIAVAAIAFGPITFSVRTPNTASQATEGQPAVATPAADLPSTSPALLADTPACEESTADREVAEFLALQIARLQAQQRTATQELLRLRERYSDEHPDVRHLIRSLDALALQEQDLTNMATRQDTSLDQLVDCTSGD